MLHVKLDFYSNHNLIEQFFFHCILQMEKIVIFALVILSCGM